MTPICPECEAGKHVNCDGGAWDFYADRATRCACAGREHRPGAALDPAILFGGAE